MSANSPTPNLSSTVWRACSRRRREFELAWQAKSEPDLGEFLPAGGPERLLLLRELVLLDVDFRAARRLPVRLLDYLLRFPELAADPTALRELAAVEQHLALLAPPGGTGPTLAVGARLGRYELLEEIGRGGFGVVHRARDTQLLRLVAIKAVTPGRWGATSTGLERFQLEARVTAQLRHPGIVALYDVGRERDLCYLVCELVTGPTLAELLQRWEQMPAAQLPGWNARVRLLLRVTEAVAHAHDQGILHRDLKPVNILLALPEPPGGATFSPELPGPAWWADPVVKVADFGLARALDQVRPGEIVGTPAYASPEQARGEDARVDARTDVYALGVILYRLLSGAAPFAPGLPRCPITPLRQVNPRIPADLEAICQQALAEEPQQRYPSAAALATDLRAFLAGEPVAQRRFGSPERWSRWARRRPLFAAVRRARSGPATGMNCGVCWRSSRCGSAIASGNAFRQPAATYAVSIQLLRGRTPAPGGKRWIANQPHLKPQKCANWWNTC